MAIEFEKVVFRSIPLSSFRATVLQDSQFTNLTLVDRSNWHRYNLEIPDFNNYAPSGVTLPAEVVITMLKKALELVAAGRQVEFGPDTPLIDAELAEHGDIVMTLKWQVFGSFAMEFKFPLSPVEVDKFVLEAQLRDMREAASEQKQRFEAELKETSQGLMAQFQDSLQRLTNDTQRLTNENVALKEVTQRLTNENSALTQRLTNDTQRLTNATQRLTNDTQRLTNENVALNERLTNENSALTHRLTNDTQSLADVTQRLTNDTQRLTNENVALNEVIQRLINQSSAITQRLTNENSELRQELAIVKLAKPYFSLSANGNTAVNNAVAWNGAHSPRNVPAELIALAADNRTVTVLRPGLYQVYVRITMYGWNSNSNTTGLSLRVNGNEVALCPQNSYTGYYNGTEVTELLPLQANDRLEVYLTYPTGFSQAQNTAVNSRFWGLFLSDMQA